MMNPWNKILGLTDPKRRVGRAALLWIALTCLLADQASKVWAVLALHRQPPVEILPGFLRLIYATNTGAAFSILSGRTMLLAAFSILVCIGLLVWAWRLPQHEQGLRIGMGLILGGAIGNILDRLRLGYVIDFIDAHWLYRAHWPTFNVADSAICIGIALIVLAGFHAAPSPAAAGNGGKKPSGTGRHG
jgi:signal peptidase II